jgi:hypothetical protein
MGASLDEGASIVRFDSGDMIGALTIDVFVGQSSEVIASASIDVEAALINGTKSYLACPSEATAGQSLSCTLYAFDAEGNPVGSSADVPSLRLGTAGQQGLIDGPVPRQRRPAAPPHERGAGCRTGVFQYRARAG